MVPSGQYRMRIVILTESRAAKGANGEEIPSWPDPEEGTGSHYAAVEQFAANEVIAQGQNHATGSKRLRIRGRFLPVTVRDRIRDKVSGEVFNVTGVVRDGGETVIDVSRVNSQEADQ